MALTGRDALALPALHGLPGREPALRGAAHAPRVGREIRPPDPLRLRLAPDQIKPYVRELAPLRGDNILRDSPFDHKHHHGLMFAIRVNGVNFWEETPGCGHEKSVVGARADARGHPRALLRHTIHWVAEPDANRAGHREVRPAGRGPDPLGHARRVLRRGPTLSPAAFQAGGTRGPRGDPHRVELQRPGPALPPGPRPARHAPDRRVPTDLAGTKQDVRRPRRRGDFDAPGQAGDRRGLRVAAEPRRRGALLLHEESVRLPGRDPGRWTRNRSATRPATRSRSIT